MSPASAAPTLAQGWSLVALIEDALAPGYGANAGTEYWLRSHAHAWGVNALIVR
jgi:hypothetical protein